MFNGSETPVGLLLNHSLYFNLVSLNRVQGYVINVTLRLFTNWEGDKPLYIFALKRMSRDYVEIMHRYPVIPERNNTQRQTIAIPFGEFPIDTGHFVGVGMQDRSDTNQICAANSVVSFCEINITNNTRYITLKFNKFFQGVAFIYSTVRNGKTIHLIKFIFISIFFLILRELKLYCDSISFSVYINVQLFK
jgi:hypothetical protein